MDEELARAYADIGTAHLNVSHKGRTSLRKNQKRVQTMMKRFLSKKKTVKTTPGSGQQNNVEGLKLLGTRKDGQNLRVVKANKQSIEEMKTLLSSFSDMQKMNGAVLQQIKEKLDGEVRTSSTGSTRIPSTIRRRLANADDPKFLMVPAELLTKNTAAAQDNEKHFTCGLLSKSPMTGMVCSTVGLMAFINNVAGVSGKFQKSIGMSLHKALRDGWKEGDLVEVKQAPGIPAKQGRIEELYDMAVGETEQKFKIQYRNFQGILAKKPTEDMEIIDNMTAEELTTHQAEVVAYAAATFSDYGEESEFHVSAAELKLHVPSSDGAQITMVCVIVCLSIVTIVIWTWFCLGNNFCCKEFCCYKYTMHGAAAAAEGSLVDDDDMMDGDADAGGD